MTMKAIRSALLFGSLLMTACQGPPGEPGEPGAEGAAGPPGETGAMGEVGAMGAMGTMGSGLTPPNVTLLTPSNGFIDRSLQVQVSAVATTFLTNAPTIDFGDAGITVSNVAVSGDANLRMMVQIAPTARFGAHDVTVTSGGQSFKLIGGFTVKPTLTAESLAMAPTVQQGGFATFNLRNQDYLANPISLLVNAPSLVGNGLFQFVNCSPFITLPANNSVSRMVAFQLIDPLAPTGASMPEVQGYDPFGTIIKYRVDPTDASLPQIAARAPTMATSGTAITGRDFPTKLATNLYALTIPANNVLVAHYTNLGTEFGAGSQGLLVGQTAPMSGKFKDGQPLSTVSYLKAAARIHSSLALMKTTGTTYISTYLNSAYGGATGYGHDVLFRTLPTVAFSAKEPMTPDSAAMPLATINLSTTTASVATDGGYDVANDVDYIRYNVPAAGDVIIAIIPQDPSMTNLFPGNVLIYPNSTCTGATTAEYGYGVETALIHDTVPAGALSRCMGIRSVTNVTVPFTVVLIAQ